MISNNLKEYIEINILPKYSQMDLAHQVDHVYNVIESSFIIARDYDVNLEMVYVVAAFHDLGLLVDRKTHHLIGGQMLRDDLFVKSYFNEEEILTMKDAVEDHRASTSDKPRNIYGLIISEADLFDTADKIIERSILYRMSSDEIDCDFIYQEVKKHIEEKYGSSGYLHSWLKSDHVFNMLNELRMLLEDENKFKEKYFNIYTKTIKK